MQSLLLARDIFQEKFCHDAIDKTLAKFGKLDILVNNAGVQFLEKDFTDIDADQVERTFRVNIFSIVTGQVIHANGGEYFG